jgi:hypothetical protein
MILAMMRLLALVLPLVLASSAFAADATKPHAHKGVLKPYPRPPPPLKLTAAEQATLDAGKAVMRQAEADAGGRGTAIFAVKATPDVTWATINEFSSYPKWIKEVKKCAVYKKDGGKIDVEFKIESFPVELTYFIHHEYDMANRWGTWTLDYTRESDLDDSVGFWRVNTVEGKPNESVVEYSVDIAIKGWVPGFIRKMLVDDGLKTATSWVKTQSEKRQAKAATAPPAPAPVPAPAPTTP